MNEKTRKIILYSIIAVVILFVLIVTVMLLGGYIKDNTTKKTCNLTDKVYVSGERPGMGICVDK